MTIYVDDNILLTSVKEEYSESIYRLFMGNIEELKDIFTFATDGFTIKDELDFIHSTGGGSAYNFYILYNGKPCGKAGLYEHNTRVNMINLIYWVAPEYRGKHIAYKCVAKLMEYSFKELYVNRVQLFINNDNINSLKLADKLGCICEGELRDCDWANGRYHTQKLYSMLAREFKLDLH